MNISSELFNNSYCIFIDKSEARAFNKAINDKGYKKESVAVLVGEFESAPACVVIPSGSNFKVIESDLFKLEGAKKGFWGQYGIGYGDKSWTKI